MFGFKDVTVNILTSSPTLVILAFLALVVLAVLLYRKTNPPLPVYVRLILAVLRLIAVVSLVLVLLEPIVGYTRQFTRSPRVSLLLDNSSSMDKIEAEKSRRTRLDSLLSSSSFARLTSQADVSRAYFGGNLASSPERVDRDKTALGDALYQLKQEQLTEPADYWLVFSDGRWNYGRDPATAVKSVALPVMCVDITTGTGNFDVGISDIEYNPVVFSGQKTEIKVKLAWQDALNKNIRIELLDSATVLDKKRLAVSQEVGFGDVTLEYLPTRPGQHILRIDIPPVEGEELTHNNHRSIAVKVLKSRLSVLLVTAHPDYEVGFLKRFLSNSGKYDVELKVTAPKSGNLYGAFPSRQSELNRYDLVILYDPDPRSLDAAQRLLSSYLNEKGGALWVLMGEQFAKRGPVAWFNRLLPFYQTKGRRAAFSPFHIQPSEGNLFHPALRLAETQSDIRERWSQLPPFLLLVPCDSVAKDAVVLASAPYAKSEQGKLPALGYKRFGPGKVFASAVLPFWTWDFVSLGFGEDNRSYKAFVEGVVSWLTVKDDFEPIRIAPQKEVFARGEPVVFEGFAYDLGYRPLPDVTGIVRLERTDGADTLETDLVPLGEGKYRADFFNIPPGKYHFTATFEKNGRLLKKDEGSLFIESFSLEEFDQRGNPAALKAIAKLSGGAYFTFEEFDRAIDAMKLAPLVESRKGEVVVWNKLWLLFAVIGALSVEWLLRKIYQLV